MHYNRRMCPAPSGTPPAADVVAGCTCSKLRRLTRRVTAVYDRALAGTGLRVTQYSLLANLRGLDGVSMTELAERLDMDRTTLTRNLGPLIASGWVRVEPGAADARRRDVRLTPEGEAQWRAARACWRQAQNEVRAAIGTEDLATLHHLLDGCVPLFRPATGHEGDPE